MARTAKCVSFPAHILSNEAFIRCGPTANSLWFVGYSCADSYGRLPASRRGLLATLLGPWIDQLQNSEEEFAAARDRLVEAGLWRAYVANGQPYIEYVGWDDDYQVKGKRGKAAYPDDPARPDRSWRQRIHKLSKGEQQQPQPEEPHSSADLLAVAPPEVPPSRVPVAPVDAEKQQAQPVEAPLSSPQPVRPAPGLPDGYAQLARAHEQHAAKPLSTDDQAKLLAVLTDAIAAGVEWQTLHTMMKEKQAEFKPTSTMRCIKNIAYYSYAWDKHIRAAMQERDGGRQAARSAPTPPAQLDTEDPRDRLRKKMAAMTGGAAHAAV